MGRTKGSRNKVVDSQGEGATQVKAAPTIVKDVKVEPVKKEENALKNGDQYLFIVDGAPTYWTKAQAITALQRNRHEIEIPKGSAFIAPANSKCKGCG